MIKAAATAEDFTKWEAHAKTLDKISLSYIRHDAAKSYEALKGYNDVRAGYYLDMAMTYYKELRERFLEQE